MLWVRDKFADRHCDFDLGTSTRYMRSQGYFQLSNSNPYSIYSVISAKNIKTVSTVRLFSSRRIAKLKENADMAEPN